MLPTTINKTMTSREIAELTGKRHADVMRDIRAMIQRLDADANLRWHCETETYTDAQGKERDQYRMDRDTTLTLVTGYDPVARMRIIQRWQELEAKQAQPIATPQSHPLLPSTQAKHIVADTLDIANLLRVPLHIGQQEAVKTARNQTGFDFAPLLAFAPAQTDVPATEVMLEPTELAQRLGVKGARSMNAILRDHGLQVKVNGEWQPTARGENLCVRHAWVSGNKSGYNLKWRLSPIRKALAPKLVDQSA